MLRDMEIETKIGKNTPSLSRQFVEACFAQIWRFLRYSDLSFANFIKSKGAKVLFQI